MTADNFKHNPPILQTNLKNVISKQLDTDNEQQMPIKISPAISAQALFIELRRKIDPYESNPGMDEICGAGDRI